jgi:hypothetical protein
LITHAEHTPGCVAFRSDPLTLHPGPVAANVTAPVPEPSVLVSAIGVPATPDVTEFVIRIPLALMTANVKATVGLTTREYTPDAALVAVTWQVAACDAESRDPETAHPAPVTE